LPEEPGSITTESLWQSFEQEIQRLRGQNADLVTEAVQHRVERDAARDQVEALKGALLALRNLAEHSSDPAILKMAIAELADAVTGG
jgi:hypothetical protein